MPPKKKKEKSDDEEWSKATVDNPQVYRKHVWRSDLTQHWYDPQSPRSEASQNSTAVLFERLASHPNLPAKKKTDQNAPRGYLTEEIKVLAESLIDKEWVDMKKSFFLI